MNTNTCKHNWKEYGEYIYWITADEPCYMPIFKCDKCGKIIKGEEMSNEEFEAIYPENEMMEV